MQAARIFPGAEDMVKGDNDEKPARRTQAERSAETRASLIDAAMAVFAEKGFAESGREEIVASAGVTRGAMYHHFADKTDLFRAVYEALEAEIMTRVAEAAVASDDPIDQLRLGCRAYLDVALDTRVRRICIVDAPAVLAPSVREEIAGVHALGLVRAALTEAIGRGQMDDQPVDALAHTVLAAVMAAAAYVGSAPDPDTARADAGRAVDSLLAGLAR